MKPFSTGPTVSLDSMNPGESGVIDKILLPEAQTLRFIELGFFPGESIRFVRRSPWGDPIEVEVMGVRQGIRSCDAAAIQVVKTEE